jgi:hypothetical protein
MRKKQVQEKLVKIEMSIFVSTRSLQSPNKPGMGIVKARVTHENYFSAILGMRIR